MTATRVVPLTTDNWGDLEALFGPRGACAGCWCMWWRLPRGEYARGSGNRDGLRELVDRAEQVGLLAYAADDDAPTGERAVGWCAVAPRAAYRRLARSPMGKGGRDEPGRWAVPCFFVDRRFRRRGLTDELLAAACEHARAAGATVLEGYPTTSPRASSAELFVGTGNLFARHGFVTVRQPTQHRIVVERLLG